MDKVQQFRLRYGEFIKFTNIHYERGYGTKDPDRVPFIAERIAHIYIIRTTKYNIIYEQIQCMIRECTD